ncbi:MAG: PDZ domain-containing protein, partial [Deltaproteobacteria bacterium]|nr:PDZ domain-containing protein [Deltaproteobacteria bacterium]
MRFTVHRRRGKGRFILLACVIAIFGLSACAHLPETGTSPSKKREAFLGIGYRIVTDSDYLRNLGFSRGLAISRIVSGSAAEKAGLRNGDIIIAWDSVKAANEPPDSLARAFIDCIKNRKAPDDPLVLTVVRTETVLEGRSDGTARIFTDSKELKQSIDSLKPDDRLDVAVTKRVAVTDITAILGERATTAYTPSAEDERQCDRLRALTDERSE